jgi:hypothetical protein
MKKSLVLHIGMGKTGTTALQKFFATNRRPLAEDGIGYPEYGAVAGAHHLLSPHIPPFLKGVWEFKPVEEWAPNLARVHASKILLSSELIAWTDENLVREFCAGAQKWFDLTVVIYLRRQDNIIMASYIQQIKAGPQKRRIIDMFHSMIPQFDYESILRPWEDSVGIPNIIVRPYEKQQLHSQDIRRDFMHHVFGIDVGRKYDVDDSNPNPRLSRVTGEYKRLINNVVEEKDRNKRFSELLKQCSTGTTVEGRANTAHDALLPADLRLRIIAANEGINGMIVDKYFDRDQGQLFLDPLPIPGEDWPGNDLSKEDAIAVSQYLRSEDPQLMLWLSGEVDNYLDAEKKVQQDAARFLAGILRLGS